MCINSAVLTSASSEFCSSWEEGGVGSVGRVGLSIFSLLLRMAISEVTDGERGLAERDFFSGLSRLSLVVEGCADAGKCLSECITLILPQVRIRFQACLCVYLFHLSGVC